MKNPRQTRAVLIGTIGILMATSYFMLDTLRAQAEQHEETTVKESPAVKERIRKLLSKGMLFEQEGKLDNAINKYKAVTELKPNHLGARIAIHRVLDLKRNLADHERDYLIEERMNDVSERLLPPKRPAYVKKFKEDFPRLQKSPTRLAIEEKLTRKIPEINFTNARLRDVIQYLSTIGGVNIILDDSVFAEETMPSVIPDRVPIELEAPYLEEIITPAEETAQAPQFAVPAGGVTDRITISLRDIPLIEALKYILRSKGLKYRIDDYAVWISQDVVSAELITRSYSLPGGIGAINKLEFAGEEGEDAMGAGVAQIEETVTLKDVIEETVPMPPGSKVLLDPRTSTLVVTNTVDNLELTEDLIDKLSVPPYQVEIETKFVEIGQTTTEELGLEVFLTDPWRWGGVQMDARTVDSAYGQLSSDPALTLPPYTGLKGFTRGLRYLTNAGGDPIGSILSMGGILTNPQFSMVLHALAQKSNIDVLSSPKVTTITGQQAQIQIVTEIMYPLEYDVTPATVSENTTTGVITTYPAAVVPGDFETRDVGIILNVTPDVGADRKTVNLTLVPEVSNLSSWQNYGGAIGDQFNPPQIVPFFTSENVSTSCIVYDGETIILGGTITEARVDRHDGIPLLGDLPYIGKLFRVENSVIVKQNLLIFVTVRIIAPTGQPLAEETITASTM